MVTTQQVDDPPSLPVGTEVSAKYKGAFCEAKVRKVVRNIKVKVAYKQGLGSGIVSDDAIKGVLRVGATVEVKHPDKREYVEATITKIQDCSQYTVVFDDGDITTLRRTALCLKSGRHFNESETLDQLPLTHPEHFGNPVIGGRRGRRSRHLHDDSSDEDDENDSKEVINEKEEHIGKVVCVESTETKKKDKEKWFPGLVVSPTAQVTVRIRVKDEYLVRSFKDGRYYTVPKKEAMEFTRELAAKQDGPAVQAALEYLDNDILPPHWDRDALFGLSNSSSEYEGEFDSDSSDDEPREEKDHFVAQLYKYMDDRGTPLNKVPSIANREVDFYRLFRTVQKLGGYNRVTSQNQWKAITMRLGFTPVTVSVTNLVKQAYKKFLQPFVDFDRKLGCSMSMTPRNANRSKGRSLVRANSVASPKPEVKETKAGPISEEVDNTTELNIDNSKSKRKVSTNSNKIKAIVEKFEEKAREESEAANKGLKSTTIKEEPQNVDMMKAGTSSVNNKKEKLNKKPVPPVDDKKGRKKKEEDATEKPIETEPEYPPVEIGDKLRVYYHEKKVTYEAKVIEISLQHSPRVFLVHYTGWNNRYDEWISRDRIAVYLSNGKSKRKAAANGQKNNEGTNQQNEAQKCAPTLSKDDEKNASIQNTTSTSSKVPSKRGRGRSDSQPPRSTTPSSTASNSSRTKSPATPATQRRATRAQPGTSRRTSNNISDISMQTDSDTDSDEPVKKPSKIMVSVSLGNMPIQGGHPIKTTATKSASSITINSQSETEEDENSTGAKGRDYDLNQIRSELKGFKELKSPSPEAENQIQTSADKKPTNVFDFSASDELENMKLTGSPTNTTKPTIPTNESKSSSTEFSSETDSFGDDDSQSSDKTTTLENMTEKLQQKIKEEKLAQAKTLERINTGKSNEKVIPIKSAGIEKIIKDSLAEKMQESMKVKPFMIEKSVYKAVEKDDKPKILTETKIPIVKPAIIQERKVIQATAVVTEKKVAPIIELKPAPMRVERKISPTNEKPQIVIKVAQKEVQPSGESPVAKVIPILAEVSVKEVPKIIVPAKTITQDVYEFKEPEPFEFEARKPQISSFSDADKKKRVIPKPCEVIPEPSRSSPGPSGMRKNKKSPTKEPDKIKQVKVDDKSPTSEPVLSSSSGGLLSPKSDSTFDVLRKSPSFNLNINALNEELATTVQETTKVLTDVPDSSASVPLPPPQKVIPFISPFIETKSDAANIFDLKTDIELMKETGEDEKSTGSKTELETVKKILLSDPGFDLEPPKIEKPSSIADKVLKALNQQKQEEDKVKEEVETTPPPPILSPILAKPLFTEIHKPSPSTSFPIPEIPKVIPSFPVTEPPKIELSAVIKKEIEIPLKKPILSSPEHKVDILESIAPKNAELSETIHKLESVIQKTSTVDHFDEDSSDSTDSERRLVIEDDSQSSDNNQNDPIGTHPLNNSSFKKSDDYCQEKVNIKPDILKEEPSIFTPKYPSIFGLQSSIYSDVALMSDAGVKPIIDLLSPMKSDLDTKQHLNLNHTETGIIAIAHELKKEESLSCQDNINLHSDSINLLLCEETIPGSPTPITKDNVDTKINVHPIEADIKPVPMDIECGPTPSSIISPIKMKADTQTPSSSPRDSVSQDDSSEDVKKHLETDHDDSMKKKRRIRKHSEGEGMNKRRRTVASSMKKNASDSDDNSDANISQRSSSSRSSRPCQYNFLVQLDPAMNPNQRIAILKKKIQELRKTYNMIKAELASIDRRRKKLRRREREKKNQHKLSS